MNHHPLHTNAWFAEHETVQGRNVVVGNLVYSIVLGMSVPDVSGSCIANLEVESLLHRSPDLPRRHHLRRDPGPRCHTIEVQGRPGHRHRGDEGLQPARRGSVLLPAQVDGLEAPPHRPAVVHTATTSGTDAHLRVRRAATARRVAAASGPDCWPGAMPTVATCPGEATRPLADPGLRGDAPTDAGVPGRACLACGFLERLSASRSLRRGEAGRRGPPAVRLGYNRRARHLHQAASCHPSTDHGGAVPRQRMPRCVRWPGWGPARRGVVLARRLG